MKKKRVYGPSAETFRGSESLAIRSQAEVAKLMGISANRVSQLERQAIRKLAKVLCK